MMIEAKKVYLSGLVRLVILAALVTFYLKGTIAWIRFANYLSHGNELGARYLTINAGIASSIPLVAGIVTFLLRRRIKTRPTVILLVAFAIGDLLLLVLSGVFAF